MGDWFAALDRLRRARPAVFAGRPVVVDLRATLAEGGAEAVGIVLDGLEARDLKLIAAEGVDAQGAGRRPLGAAGHPAAGARRLGRSTA